MTNDDTTTKRKRSKTDDKPAFVLIDYKGVIARPKTYVGQQYPDFAGQLSKKPVRHTRSPYVQAWPEPGRVAFVLQPGLNRMDTETWEHYSTRSRQVKDKIARKEIVLLDGRPDDILEIVERSYCHETLRWLHEQVSASIPTLDDPDGAEAEREHRASMLDAIQTQLAKSRPVTIRAIAWTAAPAFIPGRTRETDLAMG